MRHQKRRKRGFSKNQIRNIAQERMMILLDAVDQIAKGKPELMQRYTDLARKLAMKTRTSLPQAWRYRICRGCKKLLQPGRNCRVRIRTKRESHISITCLECDVFYPISYIV